jgi:hypothetical protein
MHTTSHIISMIGMDFIQITNTHDNIYKVIKKKCDEKRMA